MKAHYEKLDNPYWPTVLDFTEKATTPPLYKDYTKLDTNMQIELQKMLSGGSTVDEFSANMSKFMTTIDLSTGMNQIKPAGRGGSMTVFALAGFPAAIIEIG